MMPMMKLNAYLVNEMPNIIEGIGAESNALPEEVAAVKKAMGVSENVGPPIHLVKTVALMKGDSPEDETFDGRAYLYDAVTSDVLNPAQLSGALLIFSNAFDPAVVTYADRDKVEVWVDSDEVGDDSEALEILLVEGWEVVVE